MSGRREGVDLESPGRQAYRTGAVRSPGPTLPTGHHGRPDPHQFIDRDVLDDLLWKRIDGAPGADRLPLLTETEALAVADLLDELSSTYAGEKLGNTARELSGGSTTGWASESSVRAILSEVGPAGRPRALPFS